MDKSIIKSESSIKKLNYRSISESIVVPLNENTQQIYIIDCKSGRKWTKGQVFDSCLNFAYYLINDCKLSKGDVVCFVANSTDMHAVAMLGVFVAAGVYCSLSPLSTEFEIQTYFQLMKPSIVVCDESCYASLGSLSMTKKILIIGTDDKDPSSSSLLCVNDIFTSQRKPDLHLPVPSAPDDLVTITFSSGSTGWPKTVPKTNRNLLSSIETLQATDGMDVFSSDLIAIRGMELAMRALLIHGLTVGAQVVIIDGSARMDDLLNTVNAYGITYIVFIPSELNYMAKNYSKYNKNFLKCLRTVLTGSGTVSEATARFIHRSYAFKNFCICYGMTETGFVTSLSMSGGKLLDSYRSVGKLCPNTELKVVDEAGNPLPANTSGQLCIRSEQTTNGYLNISDEEKALVFTDDGFFMSGDVGYFDENRYIFFIDRIKHIIKVCGYSVSSIELENILRTVPDVSDAAVVGLADEEWGEVPVAFVTLVMDANVTDIELMEYVDSRVNHFKRLRGGVKIVNTFPMTYTGKVNKLKLKESLFLKK